jgi:hypothetical protein
MIKKFGLVAIWLTFILAGIMALFAATNLPVMEVVRNNVETGVDSDAYFYSEVRDFNSHEESVRNRLETGNR